VTEQKAEDAPPESEFTKFVRAIFAVPKAAVERAEALRPKRQRNGNGKHKNGSAT